MAPSTTIANPALWKIQGWTKTDFSKSSISFAEILSGGPPKDGIPSIDKPRFKTIKNLTTIETPKPQSPVIGLEINGDARAYPLSILIWHEIVNDSVGNTPVTVTYCPLCNAAIVFDRRDPSLKSQTGKSLKSNVLEFGTTGKLRHSDLIMYDRQTESWWQQFTGTAIIGKMLGTQLKIVPSRLESYAEFQKRHPNGKVLIPNNPNLRAYGKNPYVNYDTAKLPFLYRGEMPKGINPMARVVVIAKSSTPTAISLRLLRDKRRLKIGNITLSWRKGQASALDTAKIDMGRDVGTVIAWKKMPDGTRKDIAYDLTFAFVFHAFHPKYPIRTK